MSATTATKTTGSQTLAQLAAAAKAKHGEYTAALRKALAHAKACGEVLAEARDRVAAETELKWGAWVPRYTGIDERCANNYIRVHRGWAKIMKAVEERSGDIARLTMTGALSLIREPRAAGEGEGKGGTGSLTFGKIKSAMRKFKIGGSPRGLVDMLRELGVRLKLAEAERHDG